MLYFGLVGALLGCLIGPAIPLTLDQWLWGRLIALVSLVLFMALQKAHRKFAIVLTCLGMMLWLVLHNRPLAFTADPDLRVIFRHGENFSGLILITSDQKVVSAYGRVQIGDSVKVRCTNGKSFLSNQACFAHLTYRNTQPLESQFEKHLLGYGQTIRNWISATLFGRSEFVSIRQKKVYKETGLYHLLVVSGFHVNLMAMIAKWILLSLIWPLNCVRQITPDVWQRYIRVIDFVCVVLVWWFAAATGFGCPVQRAALCYSLVWLGFHRNKFIWGLLLQALIFPCGWLSLSNALSWSCYLVLASTSGRSWKEFLFQGVCLSTVAWVLIGSFTPLGVLVNIFFAPWFTLMISLGGLILILPYDCWFVNWYRMSVILTEDLLNQLTDFSGYFDTDLSWERWLGLAMMLALFVVYFKPKNFKWVDD